MRTPGAFDTRRAPAGGTRTGKRRYWARNGLWGCWRASYRLACLLGFGVLKFVGIRSERNLELVPAPMGGAAPELACDGSEEMRTIRYMMLTVADAADRLGEDRETVRHWIRSGRLSAQRVGKRLAIEDRDLRAIEDELFPMAKLPDEWKLGDDGSPAPNWVAALRRSRREHRTAAALPRTVEHQKMPQNRM